MAVIRKQSNLSVIEATKQRIINAFSNGVKVYFSFSGGKDSLCIAQIMVDLINERQINSAQLTVMFIDEEAIFPCIEKCVREWRKKFLLLGASFDWYCVEIRHFNCFNELANDESFICWDREKSDVWIRRPPNFAIKNHSLLKARKDTYQDFLPRICKDGIMMVGVRAAESIQRLIYMSKMNIQGNHISDRKQIFPIYDWKDCDVWLYLQRTKVEIPDIYLYLYQSGSSKKQLRVSQFFSIDTACSLVRMNEYYPNLMESIIKREPNAYLAALYWDSEMFGRSTIKRKKQEGDIKKDYKNLLIKMLSNINAFFTTPHKRKVAQSYRNFFISVSAIVSEKDCKKIYEGLISGDPKSRTLRALYQQVYGSYINNAKKEVN